MAGKAYADFIELVKEYYDVGYGQGWLQWDQEVMMPEGGAAERANQLATLAKLAHGMLTRTGWGRCSRSWTARRTSPPRRRERPRG